MNFNIMATLIILSFSYYFCIKFYKKCESLFEKIIYVLLAVMETFIVVLYYLDRYNVPTLLGWNQNVDTQNWLSLLSGFGISVIVEVLGGIILFFVTIMQINRTLEDNRNRDKEERRINNLPLLKYSFYEQSSDDTNTKVLETKIKNGILDEIIMGIKNIGMNTVRKCYINISGDILKKNLGFELNQQSSLEKKEEKTIKFLLYLTPNKFNFTFKIYYQDLTFNWYMQKIKLEYELLPISNVDLKNYSVKKIIVQDEIKLNNKPKLKLEN